MKLFLQPFNQAAFDAAYQAFHSTAPAPIVEVGTLEYMLALQLSIAEHGVVHNVSLTAIDHMTPEAAAFVRDGDLRNFTPSQAFLDDIAQHVVELIGQTHWFDTTVPLL